MTLRQWGALWRTAADNWVADRAASMGAAIAYYTCFSLAPMLVLVIAVAGLAFGETAAEGALFGQLADLVGADSAAALQAMLRSASGAKSGIIATVVGFATLLIAATPVFADPQAPLHDLWHPKTPTCFALAYPITS